MEDGSCEDGGKLCGVVCVLSCEERAGSPRKGEYFKDKELHILSLERAQLIQGTEWKQCGWDSVKGHRKECGFLIYLTKVGRLLVILNQQNNVIYFMV